MAQALVDVEKFAEGFQLVALLMFVFIIPHSVLALFAYERHPAIRYVVVHKDSGYWWSLQTWGWYVRISTAGLFLLLTFYLIRVFNKHEVVIRDLPPQPDWSYFMSMATIIIYVCILWLPSIFYLYVKYVVRHDPRIRRLVNEQAEREGS